jgi:putative FmdB family regulatory protein
MPLFEFECESCGAVFEIRVPSAGPGAEVRCPRCGSSEAQRLWSPFSSPGGAGCGGSATGFG